MSSCTMSRIIASTRAEMIFDSYSAPHANRACHGAPGMDLIRWPQDWIIVSVVPQRPGS
jgi:hypothetical protein